MTEEPEEEKKEEKRRNLADDEGSMPIEYWYIDFEYLILGEKIKNLG